MRKLGVLHVLATVLLLAVMVMPVLAQQERFEPVADGLVVRHPVKAKVGKNFNIGLYVADGLVATNPEDGSGGEYALAELYISVSGPGICTMWNDWFEYVGETIDPDDDLIVAPWEWIMDPTPEDPESGDEYTVYEYSMEYDVAVSKLGDVIGWTGNVVCNADTEGEYIFTLTGTSGVLGEFTVTVG